MKRTSFKQARPQAPAAVRAELESRRPFLSHGVQLAMLSVLVAGAVAFTHWPVLEAKALTFDD